MRLVSNIRFGALFYVVHTDLHEVFCYFYTNGAVKKYCFTNNELKTVNPKHEAAILEIKCTAVSTEHVFMYT
jgi:hypothetical protein